MYSKNPEDLPDFDIAQRQAEPDLDFESDPITKVDEDDIAAADPEKALAPTGKPSPTAPLPELYSVELNNTLVGYVETFNARDWEGVTDLLAEDATSEFFQAANAEDLIEGITDLVLRYPTLVVTRGDLGNDPVAAAWLLDQELDRYGLVGYFRFGLDDGDEPLIENLEYIEELPDTPNAVFEPPEASDIAEWDDWSLAESGE
jgi:hypothetical protein